MTEKHIWGDYAVDSLIRDFCIGEDKKYDTILLPYDLEATKAHIAMLNKIGHLTKLELTTLNAHIEILLNSVMSGNQTVPENFEDAQSFIEHYLTDKTLAGKKIHFLRSRNDQALVVIRLYLLAQIQLILKETTSLAEIFHEQSLKFKKVTMSGYTHMQPAMPTTVGTWFGCFGDAVFDSTIMLHAVRNICDQNPLGSGAGFGFVGQSVTPDKEFTTKSLSFARTQENPMYCGMSRGLFELYVVNAINMIALILSQFSQDMLLFSMKEFEFMKLPREFTTGSSIMPQKINYDCVELLRSQATLIQGYATQIHGIIAKKSSGYQRDLQLTKKPCIDAVETILLSLKVAQKIVKNVEINEKNITKSLPKEMYATAHANNLVRNGVSFRDAYESTKKGIENENE